MLSVNLLVDHCRPHRGDCEDCGGVVERGGDDFCDECWAVRQFDLLSLDDKRRMCESAHGVCALCGDAVPRLNVDHCHRCGFWRGCVCTACNVKRIPTWEDDYDKRSLLPPEYGRPYLGSCECRFGLTPTAKPASERVAA
jgi:hypothetical protein